MQASNIAIDIVAADGAGRADQEMIALGAANIGAGISQAFTVPAGSERALAHRVANEIIYRVTGKQGPFNTRFTFAGNFSADMPGPGLDDLLRGLPGAELSGAEGAFGGRRKRSRGARRARAGVYSAAAMGSTWTRRPVWKRTVPSVSA